MSLVTPIKSEQDAAFAIDKVKNYLRKKYPGAEFKLCTKSCGNRLIFLRGDIWNETEGWQLSAMFVFHRLSFNVEVYGFIESLM